MLSLDSVLFRQFSPIQNPAEIGHGTSVVLDGPCDCKGGCSRHILLKRLLLSQMSHLSGKKSTFADEQTFHPCLLPEAEHLVVLVNFPLGTIRESMLCLQILYHSLRMPFMSIGTSTRPCGASIFLWYACKKSDMTAYTL